MKLLMTRLPSQSLAPRDAKVASRVPDPSEPESFRVTVQVDPTGGHTGRSALGESGWAWTAADGQRATRAMSRKTSVTFMAGLPLCPVAFELRPTTDDRVQTRACRATQRPMTRRREPFSLRSYKARISLPTY